MTGLGTLAATEAATEITPNTSISFQHSTLPDQTFSFDCATIPANIRLDFLKSKVVHYVTNRLTSVQQRHSKDEHVVAWEAYDAAQAADPLQSTVAQPAFDRPAEPDYADAVKRAFADLAAGNVRKQSPDGAKKTREKKDPLVKAVTSIVVDDVHARKRETDPKYTIIMARTEVGSDGIVYLNKLIDEKVNAAPEADRDALRVALEKMRDTKYINPAKIMLGLTENKAIKELPSIL